MAERAEQLDRLLQRAPGVGVELREQTRGTSSRTRSAAARAASRRPAGTETAGGGARSSVDLGGARGDVVEERRVEHPAGRARRSPTGRASRAGAEPATHARAGASTRRGRTRQPVCGSSPRRRSRARRRRAPPRRRPRCRRWTPRRALLVPRVARGAVGRRLGERPQGHLGDVRLADDHRAGLAEEANHLRVRAGGFFARVRPIGGHLAGDVDVVLDGDRDAEQRPLPPAERRLSAWSASSRARSASTTRNAFKRP